MTSRAVEPPRSRPGRHRSAAVDEAILGATLDLLRQRGYADLTMAAVIERAGVSSATLYRRWTTKQDLVAAAVDFLVPDRLVGEADRLEDDLRAFLQHIVDTMAARGALAHDLALEAGRRPELAAALREKLLRPRLLELDAILCRAAQRGELTTRWPVDEALSLVLGAVYHRAILFGGGVSPAFLSAAVQGGLAALRAGTAAADPSAADRRSADAGAADERAADARSDDPAQLAG